MKKSLITGLIILLPAAITLSIFLFLIDFLTNPFLGFTTRWAEQWDLFPNGLFILTHEQTIVYISKTLILIALFAVTVLLGILARWLFMAAILDFCDRTFLKIPIVKTLYKTVADITKTLFSKDKQSFKQVVMVPFPSKETYVLGLIAQRFELLKEKEMLSILVLTTPNPTSGFLLMYEKKEIIYLNISVEDAIKYILSCGIISPNELTKSSSDI